MSDVLGIILTTFYALAFALCVWQFAFACLNRARLVSFRQSILLLSALWLLLVSRPPLDPPGAPSQARNCPGFGGRVAGLWRGRRWLVYY